MTVLQILQF